MDHKDLKETSKHSVELVESLLHQIRAFEQESGRKVADDIHLADAFRIAVEGILSLMEAQELESGLIDWAEGALVEETSRLGIEEKTSKLPIGEIQDVLRLHRE